jgi:hypothetical protein
VREYSNYVESKFIEWNKKFEIPYGYEFHLKTMFELEEQFREQPKENVKTKYDILRMIQDIYNRMSRFKERELNFKEEPCDNCIFTSKVENIEIYNDYINIYSCIKPSHPRFREVCNSKNNWKYYIPISIYNKE